MSVLLVTRVAQVSAVQKDEMEDNAELVNVRARAEEALLLSRDCRKEIKNKADIKDINGETRR